VNIKRTSIAITTAADGSFTGYSDFVTGLIHQIRLVVPGSGGLASTTDLAFTLETTGVAVLTKADQNGSATWCPRQPTHDEADGTELLHMQGVGTDHDGAPIAVHRERIKLVIAQGGNPATGTAYVWVVGGAD